MAKYPKGFDKLLRQHDQRRELGGVLESDPLPLADFMKRPPS